MTKRFFFGAIVILSALFIARPGPVLADDPPRPEPSPRPAVEAPALREYPILTERRLKLLRDYMKFHYGVDSVALEKPVMIIVHYTAISTLSGTLGTFKPDTLAKGRTDIAGHGDVNVSVQYVIDKDGTIYRLQPENIAARHAIGLNWCALGIEMVAANEKQLTAAQVEACARLCAWMASRLPSVEYLLGHHEYTKKGLPHLAYYRENDPTYTPTVKIDPGDAFMKKLRARMTEKYSITLKE